MRAEGQIAQSVGFASTMLGVSDLPTRHPYSLGLWQNHIERILAGWVHELGVPVHLGSEVIGFSQDHTSGLPRWAGVARRGRRAHPLPVRRAWIGLGIHDAVNLGWKLAQVIEGAARLSPSWTPTAPNDIRPGPVHSSTRWRSPSSSEATYGWRR
ncbi:MAG: hypothetical protein M3Q87_08500 [Actinomycetota bacterium]|nr:hypothetical protein [Actinomycetota bacterium]